MNGRRQKLSYETPGLPKQSMERKTARNWNWARPTIQFFRAYGVGGGGDVEVEVRTDLSLDLSLLASCTV